MEVTWTEFKKIVDAKSMSIQYVEIGDNYFLKLFDGPFCLDCIIPKDPTHVDTSVFEATYKVKGNKAVVTPTQVNSIPPLGSKTVMVSGVIKKLFARFTGRQYSVVAGANILTYTVTYPWVKIVGLEVVNSEALDTCTLKIYDSSTGVISGVPNLLLNQFTDTLCLPKDYYIKMSQFDADLYEGLVLEVTYTSNSAKTIGINFIMNEVKS